MKQLVLCVISIQLFLMAFCQGNIVTVSAHIKGLQSGEWVYYKKELSSGEADSAATRDGGFVFSILVPPGGGNEYLLRVGRRLEDAKPLVLLYLEKGDVALESEDTSFFNVTCEGPQSLQDYQNWTQMRVQFIYSKEVDSVYTKRTKYFRNNDDEGLAALQPALKRVDSLGTILDTQWVHQHRASPISAFVLYKNLLYLSPKELNIEINSLPDSSKNNVFATYVTDFVKVKIHDSIIGKTAAEITQPDTSGKLVSLKSFRGKYVLLDFWASWCAPCRAENPNLVSAFLKFRNKGFTILSVSLDDVTSKEDWLAAIHKDKLAWTHVSDLKGWSNAAAKQYSVNAIPVNFLIDPEGKIIGKDLSSVLLEKKLEEVL